MDDSGDSFNSFRWGNGNKAGNDVLRWLKTIEDNRS